MQREAPRDVEMLDHKGMPLPQGRAIPAEAAFCASKLMAGEVFLDVGANIGWVSVAAALKMEGQGKVFAFEPSSLYSKVLEKNVAMNGVEDIVCVVPCAVGDREGSARFVHSGWSGSTSGFYTDGSEGTSMNPSTNRLLSQALHGGVYVYSTGGSAKELVRTLRANPANRILGFLDTYRPTGEELEGLPVYNVQEGLAVRNGHMILIAGMFRWEIERSLRARGLRPEKDFIHIATSGSVETVPQVSIDGFVRQQNLEEVDFIKVDVDGGEPAVLSGAAETLGRFRPKLFIEVSRYQGNHRKVWEILVESGYRILKDDGAVAWESFDAYAESIQETMATNIFAE